MTKKKEESQRSTHKEMTPEILQNIVKTSGPKMAGQSERIRQIFGTEKGGRARVSEVTLERYRGYLKANLELPCIVTGT